MNERELTEEEREAYDAYIESVLAPAMKRPALTIIDGLMAFTICLFMSGVIALVVHLFWIVISVGWNIL